MDSRAAELVKQGNNLFGKRNSLLNLWQEIAEQFHPTRADFTQKIIPGDDLTSHLSSSYPVLAHRDMTNALSAMLRQRGVHWFEIRSDRGEEDEGRALEWLEWASRVQYRAMYDRKANFVRATKEGDGDFAAFGQAVVYVDVNRDSDALLYRNYHIRDVVWMENAAGAIDTIHRKWKPTAQQLVYDFGDDVSETVKKQLDSGKDPYREFECRHIMVPTDRALDVKKEWKRFPFQSYFIDVENEHVMQHVPSPLLRYVIPRWMTVSGSQYAYSPAVIAALPDARMIQGMTYSLLDATEKASQPPMVAQAGMMKSDLELWSGGVTWVDAEYDERLGDALRPIPQDYRALPVGWEAHRDARGMIAEAFFLNKISLPPAEREMTAYETAQRIQEYIRQALPLFEPMEQEYNGGLCEMTFETLMLNNAFGSQEDIPEELSGQEVQFRFASPLQDNEERKTAQTFLEAKELLAVAASMDPSLAHMVDGREALRDALRGAGVPAKWTRDDLEMDQAEAELTQQMEAQQMMANLEQGSGIAKNMSEAAVNMTEAGGEI